MDNQSEIPLFPLTLLPLPGELVPLHIFEPRYRQLVDDMERLDISFGIYCNHEINEARLGSIMKLESVIKKYPTGESDIVVRCLDIFSLDKMLRTYNDKMYPGGNVRTWSVDIRIPADHSVYDLFLNLREKRNMTRHIDIYSLFHIAGELNLDVFDRYKFLTFPPEKASVFILNQLKFQLHLFDQEDKSRDMYHLN
ncbi:MAG TPA: LON peptidase substrate-binding domain-containing protein [Chryseosolibacter sp.]|nr:LON peptidase substrate-binding domain-containing protein [Chryseosolibacter sp.]